MTEIVAAPMAPGAPNEGRMVLVDKEKMRVEFDAAVERAAKNAATTARKREKAEGDARLALVTQQMADAHVQELQRQRAILLVEWTDKHKHSLRAARLWAGLTAFAVGALLAGTMATAVMWKATTSGADVGIDAMSKSRIIEESIRRPRDDDPEDQGVRRGVEPLSAP